MMPNPDGTYTREEHRVAIMSLFDKNIRNGMEPEVAMACAGREWRKTIREMGDAKIAIVKERLGIR